MLMIIFINIYLFLTFSLKYYYKSYLDTKTIKLNNSFN